MSQLDIRNTKRSVASPVIDTIVRAARLQEVDELIAIKTRSIMQLCGTHYSAEILQSRVEESKLLDYPTAVRDKEILVAERSGKVVGYVWINSVFDMKELYVEPENIRQGVGTALLLEGINRITRVGIGRFIIDALLNSVPFYQRHGFKPRRESHIHNSVTGKIFTVMEMERVLWKPD